MSFITSSGFGTSKWGRFGNQLFQYASLIGIADKHGCELSIPHWDCANYFQGAFPKGSRPAHKITEPAFHFTPDYWKYQIEHHGSIDISGWLQTEKYWAHCEKKVRDALRFKDDFVKSTVGKFGVIATAINKCTYRPVFVSVRRGDFVNNPNYEQLPITYYILALLEHFPDWKNRVVVFLSDDIAYCKHHFGGFDNCYFLDGSPQEQMAFCSLVQPHFIISQSTFSWWCAYLSESGDGTQRIIRPNYNFAGDLKKKNNETDYYPERWTVFDHMNNGVPKRIQLQDVTFTVPVFFDSQDRKQNLELNICLLHRFFDTNIIVGEQGSNKFGYMGQWCKYVRFATMQHFHRTQMLNDMAHMADTPILVNWDADVVLSPMQILESVNRIRAGADMVYPYDGRFARVPRVPWFSEMEKYLDSGIFCEHLFRGMRPHDMASVGGAIFFNKDAFFKYGGENENFISYGPEDRERWYRFNKLGAKVERVKGVIYHLDHQVLVNSSTKNPFFNSNNEVEKRIMALSGDALREHVATWAWTR